MATLSRFFRSTFAVFEAATTNPKPSSSSAKIGARKPKSSFALFVPVPVSSALSSFLGGVTEASRYVAVKKIWEHIKLNNLQNPANKREINCDDKLKTIFDGKDKVEFLEIAKLLSTHFVKANKG